MAKLRIGIIGCGAIGKSLAKAILKDFKSKAELAALYDINPEKSANLVKLIQRKNLAVSSFGQLIQKSDLVIETASSKASWNIARQVLTKGRDILLMSVGGVIDKGRQLSRLALKHDAKVYIPSGAICGLDAVKAANIGKIREVVLTTIKNPKAFKGVEYAMKFNLIGLKADKILFFGPAKQAVKYFPQNINVAAALSMAGIGQVKTKVKIIASPKAKNNIHEIRVLSSAGAITARAQNLLHPDNPKTSYLAVLSAIATIRQILEPVKIGT
ncbi:MAG TPA: aspartate dehydrogenase [Candidatus Omnitrophota bacterium]|nr:aspartate dehydrogenase [Candidatus Omnitrophota bacterium]